MNWLISLLQSWWQQDRIRVRPGEGRLLRLQPASLIRVQGSFFQILTRHVGCNGGGTFVRYLCDGDEMNAELWVFPIGERKDPLIRWLMGAQETAVSLDEIEVFS